MKNFNDREFLQVSTAVEKKEDADRIVRVLVETRLAACVQIVGPIESTYRWKGRIEKTGELLCLIKTSRDLYTELERAIREVHPYETPEIVAAPIVQGSADYMAWLHENLREGNAEETFRPEDAGE